MPNGMYGGVRGGLIAPYSIIIGNSSWRRNLDEKARIKAGTRTRQLLKEVYIETFLRFITIPVIIFS